MNSTIITALFDIGRDKNGDGRTIDQYLSWFDKTLSLNTPMVIYTEKKFKHFVEQRRSSENTKIVIQNLTEIPYYKYKEKIESILNSQVYKSKIKDPNRIECNLSLYNIIQYSKFDWIKDVIDKNICESDYYFWMDAGCSRFFQNADLSKPWPSNKELMNHDKFLIQGNSNTLYYPITSIENYVWDCNCILVGTLFGGSKDICIKMQELVNTEFVNYLDRGITNNEQIILAILYKKYPNLFNVYIELNGQHLPLFKKLAS